MYKKILFFLFLAAIFASCGVRKSSIVSTSKATAEQKKVIDFGMKYLNKPYKYAAKGPNAFDCSGFTSFVFREFGYRLDPSSAGQDKQVPTIRRKKDLQVGDLVFFEGRKHNGRVGHVGIVKDVLANDEFTFLHASTGNGVIVSRSTEEYYASRYLRGGRILEQTPSKQKKGNKQENVFVTAKSKNPIDIEPTVISAKKEEKVEVAQKTDSLQFEPMRNDTLIIHSRPAQKLLTDSVPNKQKEDSIKQQVDQAMIQPDTIIVPEPIESEVDSSQIILHTVKPGETLYSISRKYNCTADKIKRWNPQIGTVLKSGITLQIRK